MKRRNKKDKKLKRFLKIAFPLVILSILAAFFIDIKTSIIGLLFLLLFAAYSIYKEKIGEELIVALIIALSWTSYYFYEYNSGNIFIGDINLFPLVCWTFGLVVLREIYEKIGGTSRFFRIIALYWITLFVIEALGYYILGIHLDSNYSGMFGVIHGPLIMKIFYLTAGPIYLLITDYLKVK